MTATDHTKTPTAGKSHNHGLTAADKAFVTKAEFDALVLRVTALEPDVVPPPVVPPPVPPPLNIPAAAWTPLYVVGDPGYGLDSDFLGSKAQVVFAGDGFTITAERKATPSGRAYASACLAAKGHARLHGTVEARIRYPAGQGVWPALWMLQEGKVTTPPEVDIFEAYPAPSGAGGGSGIDTLITSNHATGGVTHFVVDRPNLSGQWHTHRLVWSAGLMVFSIDGVESGRIDRNVPDVPMYPIVTLALGAPGFRVDGTTPSRLTMDVEYVRVTP